MRRLLIILFYLTVTHAAPLTFTVSQSPAPIPPGGTGEVVVRVVNTAPSPLKAVRVRLECPPPLSASPSGGSLGDVGIGGLAVFRAGLRVPPDARPGGYNISVVVSCVYCEGDVCRRVVLRREFPIEVGSAPHHLPLWPLAASLALATAIALTVRAGSPLPLLVTVAVLLLAYGVANGQHIAAWSVVKNLCLSCTGLESPVFGVGEEVVRCVRGLRTPVHLYLFTSRWCTACPRVERVLEELVRESGDLLRVEVVDVDERPDLAAEYGVARGPHVVVPALALVGDPNSTLLGAEGVLRGLPRLLGGCGAP